MRKLLNTIYNFHWVTRGEIARSAQAHFRGLSVMLASQKIRGLVNLRGHNPDYGWWRYETRICEKLGVAHFDAMLDSRKLPTRARASGTAIRTLAVFAFSQGASALAQTVHRVRRG